MKIGKRKLKQNFNILKIRLMKTQAQKNFTVVLLYGIVM